MHMVQRLSAVLLLAAAAEYSFAEARAVPVIGEPARLESLPGPSPSPVGELYSRGNSQSAQADTPSATASEPAKPQDGKSVGNPSAAPTVKTAVFPTAVDPKYAHELGPLGRMRTCADQFTANKATNANGGMKWIDRSGGYYLECSKRLKG
jgi:hypothetical protein